MADASRAGSSANACELTYERIFAAPREKVFRAWTDPSVLARWWGPKDATIPQLAIDLRVGGKWMTVMRMESGREHIVSGVYREIVPPSRLVFTWAWENDGVRGHETIVTVEFEDRGDTTLMRFHQGRFESADTTALHNEGWTSTFDGFADFIAGGGLD